MKNKLLTILIIVILLILPAPTMAQTQENQPGILDSLGSVISQLLTLNNPVHLENPKTHFSLDESPVFILIIPQKNNDLIGQTTEDAWNNGDEQITASIIRKKNEELASSTDKPLATLIKKLEAGKFEISLKDPIKVLGNYSLNLTAKESFFYSREIILNFDWSNDQPADNPIENSPTPNPNRGLIRNVLKKEPRISGGWLKNFLIKNPEYQKMLAVKLDRNSVHFLKPDGTIEAQISSGPVNYQDEKGEWKPIDPTLTQVGDELVGQGTSAKIKLDGTVEANGVNHTQKTTKFGWFDPATQEFTPVQDLPAGQVKEDQFIRSGDYFEHVLTLLDTGLKEELTLNDLPPNLPDNPNSYLMLETEVTGLNLPDGWIEEEIKSGGFNFPLPTTKDASGKEIPTKRFAKKVNGIQYIYTGILLSDLKTAAFPVVIDPDFTSNTNDAWIYGQEATYAAARSTSKGYYSSLEFNCVGQVSSAWQEVYRTYLSFNTSSIGDNLIAQVNLKMVATSDNATTEFDVQIVKYNWSAWAADPTNSTKREIAYDNCLGGTIDNNIWRNSSGISVNTQYISGNLDTSWVSKTEVTYYCLRSDRDLNSNAPSDSEYLSLGSADNTTPGYRPFLTVTYFPNQIDLEGVDMQGVDIN